MVRVTYLIRSRLFAFKIFLGLGVGVTYLIRRFFQNILGLGDGVTYLIRRLFAFKIFFWVFKIFLGLGFGCWGKRGVYTADSWGYGLRVRANEIICLSCVIGS